MLGTVAAPAVPSAFVFGNFAVIFGDGADPVVVTCSGDALQLNGADPNTGPALCSAIETILVFGGPGASTIDFTGANFPASQTVFITAGDADDTITLEGGIFAAGTAMTITGSGGNDTIIGSSLPETIAGGVGNDTITGGGGDDTIAGGDGDDNILWFNGDGSDTISGDAGNDSVSATGGAGDDQLEIRTDGTSTFIQRNNLTPFVLTVTLVESATLDGGAGSDLVFSSDLTGVPTLTAVTLRGGTEDDILDGSALPAGVVALTLEGGGGNDLLTGSAGIDAMFGDAGNDTLIGRQGGDQMSGGDDDDLLVWNNGDGSDLMEGDAGADRVQVNGSNTAGDDFLVSPNGTRVRFDRLNLGLFNLDIGTVETLEVNGQIGADIMNVADLTGIADLTAIDLNGGDDNDTFDATNLVAGIVTLTERGDNGDDSLTGSRGADVMEGGAGIDTLVGRQGNDLMSGGDDDDVLVWNNGDGSDIMDGDAGDDLVRVNGSTTAGDQFSVTANAMRLRFDRLNLGLFNLDIGTTENLEVNGLGGDDLMTVADLTGVADLSAIVLDGGDDNDTLNASLLAAGVVALTEIGGAGDDMLTGGFGADLMDGGTGNDTLVGRQGNDQMFGGDDNDLLVWNNGDGSDLMEGDAGSDTVNVNGSTTAGDDFLVAANGTRVQFDRLNLGLFTLDIGTVETLTVNSQGGDDLVNVADLTGVADLTSLNLNGDEGNDTIDASPLPAGIAVVSLSGGDDDDMLTGSGGIDTLLGGGGNDTLVGQRGNDLMLGGDGDDLLVWNNGDGSDLMEGEAGDDRVEVNGSTGSGDDFAVTPNGTRVRFDRLNLGLFTLDIGTVETLTVNGLGGDDVMNVADLTGIADLTAITLDGGDDNDTFDASNLVAGIVVLTELGGDGVDSLTGSRGADVLDGGPGDDLIIGRQGNDTMLGGDDDDALVWNNGDGSDLMEGDAGNDGVIVNGSGTSGDDFAVTANGDRVRFDRINLGLFTLDIGTAETLTVNSQGGDDILTIADLTGIADLTSIVLEAGDDNDTLDASALPGGIVSLIAMGGPGDDSLTGSRGADSLVGGTGNDTLVGRQGADMMFGGDDDDTLIWNNGDGSDLMEGEVGNDIVLVNGSTTAGDQFGVASNGARVRFDRFNLVPFTLDIGTTEVMIVNGLDGDEFMTVSDLTGVADLTSLSLNGDLGNDQINASALLSGVVTLLITGGDGDDVLTGSEGADQMFGGAGNDRLVGHRGADQMFGEDGNDTLVWNNGDGSDLMEGDADDDTIEVNGSPTGSDNFVVGPNGVRVQFQRVNLGLFTLDIGTAEALDVRGLDGDEDFLVNDLTGTPMTAVTYTGAGGADQLNVAGTDVDDTIVVTATTVTRAGIVVTFDGTTETLRVDSLDGDDLVQATSSPTTAMFLDGGPHSSGDTLEFDSMGRPAIHTEGDPGTIDVIGDALVSYSDFESITVVAPPLGPAGIIVY